MPIICTFVEVLPFGRCSEICTDEVGHREAALQEHASINGHQSVEAMLAKKGTAEIFVYHKLVKAEMTASCVS